MAPDIIMLLQFNPDRVWATNIDACVEGWGGGIGGELWEISAAETEITKRDFRFSVCSNTLGEIPPLFCLVEARTKDRLTDQKRGYNEHRKNRLIMKTYCHPVVLLSACVTSLINDASSFLLPITIPRPFPRRTAVAPLSMAGFGGGDKGSASAGGAGKVPKLKAKSQWDRYAELKQSKKVTVGVRIRGDDDGAGWGEWMEVGRVRSEDENLADAAIARQRALIAEHSKRLYPVQIPPNAILEWGYRTDIEEDGDGGGDAVWAVVDKKKGDDVPAGFEKRIGFEGISDKATGYYCFYNEGRIVERGEAEGKNSLRLQRTASKSDVGTKPGGASRGS